MTDYNRFEFFFKFSGFLDASKIVLSENNFELRALEV